MIIYTVLTSYLVSGLHCNAEDFEEMSVTNRKFSKYL